MVTGWRRAFCTSIPKDTETPNSTTTASAAANSPRIGSKFGFFSNPSTPRLHSQSQSQPVSTPTLRCRTTAAAATAPTSSVPNSPKLQCNTTSSTPKNSISPRLFNFSNPSSPKSPSSFSILKSAFRLSKSRCGVCLQNVKSGQGTAIFTAECGHVFHFPCIVNKSRNQNQNHLLLCPVCSSTWKELPLLSIHHDSDEIYKKSSEKVKELSKSKNLRVYNDDEPLRSPSPASLFNPIPELEENDVEEGDGSVTAHEFQGFCVAPVPVKATKLVEVTLLPESSIVAVGRSYQTQVVVLKVKAPPPSPSARRLPIDLVIVVDVSERMRGFKLQMMKRMMRLMISSLNSTDRLSVVAFSAASKRLLPLKRMTPDGRRSVRRIVDALGNTGQGMSATDALKKAAKVIEDRRVKNPVASIIILSNGHDDRPHTNYATEKRSSSLVSSTRFSQLDIPVHMINFNEISASNSQLEDALVKRVNGLLTIAVQDLKLELGFVSGSAPAEIAAVYPLTGQPTVFGAGSVRIGNLYAEEERELLVELKVAASSSIRSHPILSVRSSFKDPLTHEPILSKEHSLLVPRPQAVRSSLPNIKRLRELHISTRAIAESRRLMEHKDLSGAYHLLSSARALLMQSSDESTNENVRGLEAELGELHRRRQQMVQSQSQNQNQRQRSNQQAEEKTEPLTPTSAWRAAERLAKVAIMRKHMNRVSDLHGFENARF
ncbi:E3 ubiquitin-protein ligase WAVH1 [Euphorbia lathyris]|uniref:E3 ubiquitin-protein ligase WAVH1 n=1 Tax=Euphorbia lathyris TaxID=212925 RepID=UPI003314035A